MVISELITYKTIIVFGVLLLLFVAERVLPAVPVATAVANGRRLFRNLSLWFCNSLASLLIVLPVTLYAANHASYWWSAWLPQWSWLLVDLLLLDLWIYWWHRANHRISWLWRFHRVHHLDQWLDVTSALRFHFGEVILSALVRAAVIFCFALPLSSVIIFESLIIIFTGFHHSNIRLPRKLERYLSWLIITPSIHWVHHHVEQRDTDSNYGAIFSFWDRLFGSRSATARTPDMVIGLDRSVDQGLLQLLVAPFQSQPARQ